MQNQLFPLIRGAEQSVSPSSRSAMKHDKQASVGPTPFADVIHQLDDKQTSTMTKNSTLALTQKPAKGEYDAEIIDAIAIRDHDKAADDDLPIGRDVSDHDIVPLPLLTTGREADQPYLETQSATLNLDSRASQPTVDSHAIAPQYLPASKGLDAGAIATQFPVHLQLRLKGKLRHRRTFMLFVVRSNLLSYHSKGLNKARSHAFRKLSNRRLP